MDTSSLKQWRKKRKLSLAKLAKAAGTSSQQIVRLEAGQRKLTKEWAERLAPALNISAQELLFPSTEFVPIVGELANAQAHLGEKQLGRAPMPPGGYSGIAAIRVTDDTAYGIAGEGWLLYFENVHRPIQPHLYGKVCLLGYRDGTVRVGVLQPSANPKLYNIERPGAPTLRDQMLAWGTEVLSMVSPSAAERLEIKSDVA